PSPIEASAKAAYLAAYNADPNRATNFPRTPDQFRVLGGVTYADANNRSVWNTDKHNLQPRVGASYQVNEKTVVRGGFGIFMAPFQIETPLQVGFSASTPFVASNDNGRTFVGTLSNPFPSGLQAAPGASLGLLTRLGQDV